MTYPDPPPSPNAQGAPSNPTADILAFPRFSTWYVVFLSVITLGVYSVYWMYNRSMLLEQIHPKEPINKNFMFLCIGVWALSFIFSMTSGPTMNAPGPHPQGLPPSFLIQFVSAVLFLIWAFLFHARLNRFLQAAGLPHRTLHPIFTFLFQAFYLSYKINQNIDLAQAATPNGGRPTGPNDSGSMTA